MSKKCNHSKQCDSCIRDEIKVLEDKVAKLKAKLPQQTITIINGCHGHCYHGIGICTHGYYHSHNTPYYYVNMQNQASNAIVTAGYQSSLNQANSSTTYTTASSLNTDYQQGSIAQ